MAISRLSETTLQTGFQKFNTLWDGRSAVSAIDTISGVTLSTTTSGVIFNNIPQTYSHLIIKGYSLSSATNDDICLRFNNDSTTNYSTHYVYSTGAATATNGSANTSFIFISTNAGDSTYPCVFQTTILDYTNTGKGKTVSTLAGYDRNGSGQIQLEIGAWRSNSAIDTINVFSGTGTNLLANSYYVLYGVK